MVKKPDDWFDLRAECRAIAPEVMLRLLKFIDDDEATPTQLAACREILDRAYGKPAQTVVDIGVKLPHSAELEAYIEERRKAAMKQIG